MHPTTEGNQRKDGSSFGFMVGKSHFSPKTLRQLSAKGIEISGIQAVPGFEGDQYFSGTAYQLVWNGIGFLRTFSQVIVLAQSSWDPAVYFSDVQLNPQQV